MCSGVGAEVVLAGLWWIEVGPWVGEEVVGVEVEEGGSPLSVLSVAPGCFLLC